MRKWLAKLVCVTLWTASLPAHAYVPPAEGLCRLLAEVRRLPGVRDVTLTLTADLSGHDHQVDERLYLKRSERMRLVQQEETPRIFIEREGTAVMLQGTTRQGGPEPSSNVLPVLLMARLQSVEELTVRFMAALRAARIDVDTVALARQGDAVAYVIGARAWENDRPQLWLDKVSLQPIRIITQGPPSGDGVAGKRLEMRLLAYGQGPAGNHFPKTFEQYEDGALVRRAEVTAARFNQNLPETLFDWDSRRR